MARMELDEEGEKVRGCVTMRDGEAKRRVGNEPVDTWRYRTEGERLEILRVWFRIVLTAEETRGIRGLSTELKG